MSLSRVLAWPDQEVSGSSGSSDEAGPAATVRTTGRCQSSGISGHVPALTSSFATAA